MCFSQQQIKEKVKAFIAKQFFFNATNFSLNETESFIENGIIDSTGILELIRFLQNEYGIIVEDKEILPENLNSLNAVAKFISDKIVGN